MSLQLIHQYYNQRDQIKRVGISNEMAIKQPFDSLILNFASQKNNIYVTEVSIKNEKGKNIRPDGTLMNNFRIHKGYIESKDGNDTLDFEINKKLYKDLYPNFNILFQDGKTAVLFQKGIRLQEIDMNNAEDLEKIILQFINYKPEYIEKFEEALEKFKEDIPTIVETLRDTISDAYKNNPKFVSASEDFFEMCQKEINPQIAKEDIREMIIQHILTEDLFKSVFDESDFHHENNIAHQLENLVNTFMTREVRQNKLNELGHYYKTLNAQASTVSDHHEKQKFLKVVYENFYKVYNPKGADKLGVVYTPNEIVKFMVRSTDYLLQKHFNRNLADKNVNILDPATGTGTFVTDIIDFIPQQYLEHKYKHEIFANEVAILPYYVANLNIEYTYKQKMGKYVEFPNSCFVDTLDNIGALSYKGGKQISLFGLSSENAERIKRQNEQKISVIIGNPPYNANQANFNDFNKNREYNEVDKRIKETYVKQSSAQKTKVYDMYARFYRWATDRIDENGILSFITNRSFIDSRTFDGFRKVIASEFNQIYIIDLGGDVRSNPKLSGPKNNVFAIQTGVAIMILVKEKTDNKISAKISYVRRPEEELAVDKLNFLNNTKFQDLAFDVINPDKNNNWLNLSENDFESLIPLISKEGKETIFNRFSNGVATNRDEWVYDFNEENLKNKSKFLSDEFNLSVEKNILKENIKWSRDLENKYKRKLKSKYNENKIVKAFYKPFAIKYYYSEKIFSDVLTQNHATFFGKELNLKNKCIGYIGKDTVIPFSVLSFENINDLNSLSNAAGGNKTMPQFIYDENGNRFDNITDWGLQQFQNFYEKPTTNNQQPTTKITKEDIFYYTYAVLHNPEYRKKYELNLKRDFPRLPFYPDFKKWADLGKKLMDIHLNFEEAKEFPLSVNSKKIELPKEYKLKVKLKANKEEGSIELDELTTITEIPTLAWEYKLGNRNALEWILDQYKEKKPTDKTIAEKFNTYRFADYKTEVISLLKKITTVSVETMEILQEMEKMPQ